MKNYLVAFIVVLLAACATKPPAQYAKDGASRDEFDEVVYRCLQKTVVGERGTIKNAYGVVRATTGSVNCDKFNACLASKGFKKSAKGTFVVKDFEEIDCKQ